MANKYELKELKIAHEELLKNHRELEKCVEDLKIANENLDTEELEKKKRTEELNSDLSEMMFTVSHRIRKSVANILGISYMLCDNDKIENAELREMLRIIIQSAESLNTATEELAKFIDIKKKS